MTTKSLIDQIDDLLPQTQCTKCGYQGCRPYAQAIADQQASYNQCPPGGAEGIARLAHLLHKPIIPLNPLNGKERPRSVALIDESVCIGCTLCIQACPVDAIVGAAKQLHTVISEQCTGCDLCIAPCPVDCITMVNVSGQKTGWQAWSKEQAEQARQHYQAHLARQKKPSHQVGQKKQTPLAENKKALIAAALARAKAKQSHHSPKDSSCDPDEKK